MTSAIRSLGKAYVELHGDYSKLGPEAERAIKAEVEKATDKITFDDLAEKAGQSGSKAGRNFGERFVRDAAGRLRDLRGRFISEAEAVALGLENALIGSGGGGAGGGGSGFRIRNFFRGIGEAVSDFADSVGEKFKAVGSIVSNIGQAFTSVGTIIYTVLIISAIPAIFGLAGALVHLTGILLLLPAALGTVVSALIPLILAFQGLGTALSAGLSGDTEKFNEALKKLAPSARAVTKEIVALKKPFDALKLAVQEAFFRPLVGTFRDLGRTTFPVFQAGLAKIASALGFLFRDVLGTFKTPAGLAALRAVLDATLQIVQRFEPALTNFFTAMGNASKAGAPFAVRFFRAIADGLTAFSAFIDKAVQTGDFQRFLERAFQIGKDLFGILGSVGRLIGTLFGGQNVFEGSSTFLQDIAEAIDQLTAFFASPDGQQAIEGMLEILKTLGIVLIAVAIGFGKAIHFAERFGSALDTGLTAVARFLEAFGRGFVDVLKVIGGFFADVGSAISDFFTNTIPETFDKVVNFFSELPGRLKSGAQTAFTDLVAAIGEQVGKVVGSILAIPFLIEQIPGKIREILANIGQFFSELPLKAQIELARLSGIISGVLSRAFEDAKNVVVNGIETVMRFLNSLPGRVASLGQALLNAARSLGRKIGDGLAEIGNFASDIGRRIVSTVKSGINFIIDSINRGIASIDDQIPVSLPRLPRLAKGAIVNDPTLALVGEAGPEVVVPLSDPNRARQLAEESGLTAILNQVSGAPIVNVTAILDGIGIIKVIKTVVDTKFDQQGQELAFGART